MARVIKETVVTDRDSEPAVRERSNEQATAARIVWFFAGLLLAIIALRFVFSLLGANRGNGFADFIYDTSHPFVSPFFGLFSYDPVYGRSHFELYTLVAMIVYYFIAWGIARLITINRPTAEV